MNYTAPQVQNEYLGRRIAGVGGTRSRDRLARLPKCCIQNLYRSLVAAPRDEDKSDMVNELWRRYQWGDELWSRVPSEEAFARLVRDAKKAGLPAPRY